MGKDETSQSMNLAYLRDVSKFSRRLQLGRFEQPLRGHIRGVLIAGLVACFVILAVHPRWWPVLENDLTEPITGWAFSAVYGLTAVLLLFMGHVASGLILGSQRDGAVLPVLSRFFTSFFSVLIALGCASQFSTVLWIVYNGGSDLYTLPLYWKLLAALQFLLGTAALTFATLSLVRGFFSSPRAVAWASRSIKFAFYCLTAAFLVYVPWQAYLHRIGYYNTFNPKEMQQLLIKNSYAPGQQLRVIFQPIFFFAGLIFFWQVLVEAKVFSRYAGMSVVNLTTRFPKTLAVLFVVKLGYLALILLGRLPNPSFEVSQMNEQPDTWSSWLVAAVFAGAAAWWLLHEKVRLNRFESTRSSVVLVLGWSLISIVTYTIIIVAIVLIGFGSLLDFVSPQLLPGIDSSFQNLLEIGNSLRSFEDPYTRGFISVLLPLGLVLARFPKFRHYAPIFILTGLWNLPVPLNILRDEIFGKDAFPQLKFGFDYFTFDVLLTFILLAFFILGSKNALSPQRLKAICLILVASTLVMLFQGPLDLGGTYLGFSVLLVFPFLYQLSFDAEALNAAATTDGQRVLRILSAEAALMLIVALAVVFRYLIPGDVNESTFADLKFAPPFMFLFLATTIATFRTGSEEVLGDGEAL